ncbi:MmcQ/YjbR family DNA-binding protein [Haliangium sp. UPWRP_2]|uniref:MmcQ/YjbR family DNA-binding protein n=1 Tax=Haliangium sp. UPWRP_2 TaxID=1931276 RepID=UPI000D0D02CB|nr:MmcQ/YjbR family DNA-binding protein [Haliangium sp. UPWRP_2]PSM32158.1 hypothetical protein BVG81_001590 [Haliangium sp. UPWRP_2]HNN95759.1 MmcQ/YjbR family DNA-binding protein [Pseudomonadota bacterium]
MEKTTKKALPSRTKTTAGRTPSGATKPAKSASSPPAAAARPAQKPGAGLSGKAIFAALQKHALSKPGAVEEYPWGDVAWKVRGKLFAVTGQDAAGVTVKASLEDQAVLVQHPAIKIAPYVGRFGWVAIEIGDAETLALACQLIDESYAALAGSTGKPRRASKPSSTPRSRTSRPAAP